MNSNTRLLVTRSGPAGQRLADRLRAAGLDTVWYSPVRLVGVSQPAELRRRLEALLPADVLVVPSPEALRRLAEMKPPHTLGQTPLVVPGPGSADLARELGFLSVRSPDSAGTSEDMLELPELSAVAGQRILILAAAGGRRLIEQTLAERGAEVHRLHIYRREAVPPQPDVTGLLSVAEDLVTLLGSGGALAGLADQLEAPAWGAIQRGLVIAPSQRVAEEAMARGCGRVEAATGADDQAMLEALLLARMDLKQWVTL